MLNLSPQTDEQLVLRITRGEAAALEQLYDRYVRQCFGLALRMLGDEALAEEVVQEIFMKLWSQPQSYSPERGKFGSWLLSLVHHKAVDELRRRSRTEAALETPGAEGTQNILETTPDPGADPGDQVVVQEQQRLVRQALEQISPPQRQVLELAYFKGLSQSQIAAKLNQPLGTVKTRMRLGLQSLRGKLEQVGLLADEAGNT